MTVIDCRQGNEEENATSLLAESKMLWSMGGRISRLVTLPALFAWFVAGITVEPDLLKMAALLTGW
jgi:hypothetical protein